MSEKIKLMIVDDDKGFIEIMKKIFLMDENFIVKSYTDPILALENKNISDFDLIMVDLFMPQMNGLTFLEKIKEKYPLKHVIMLTGQGSIDTAVEAMALGAVNYIEKPVSPETLIQKIHAMLDYREEEGTLKEHLEDKEDESIMVGISQSIENIRKNARIVSGSNSAVLITGESGTGKEIAAELIYSNSNRNRGPFIKINCAALPETLFESELFGYEKGAFTGAEKSKKGKIELANGGTLFLDEIGELSLNMQTKLLRVLQQREIERLGGERPIPIDVRWICATNRDLMKAIANGEFREDLYYRINVIELHIAPLRERPEDVEPLVRHYFKEYGEATHKDIPMPSPKIMEVLKKYEWPGNVRELKNTVERLFVFGKNKKPIEMSNLQKHLWVDGNRSEGNSEDPDLRAARNEFERNYLIDMLESNNWNITHTAEIIGLSRRSLQKKIKAMNIIKPEELE